MINIIKAKIEKIMSDNDIIFASVANLANNSITYIGDKTQLKYSSLVDDLFDDIAQVRKLNNSIINQSLPQSWNQGIVKCLVCKPEDNIIIGLFFHEYRNPIESYHFGSYINELITKNLI